MILLSEFTATPIGKHIGCGQTVYREDAAPHKVFCPIHGNLNNSEIENQNDKEVTG